MELCSFQLSSGWKILLCNAFLKNSLLIGEIKTGHFILKVTLFIFK